MKETFFLWKVLIIFKWDFYEKLTRGGKGKEKCYKTKFDPKIRILSFDILVINLYTQLSIYNLSAPTKNVLL